MAKQTFHIFITNGRSQQRFTHMAADHAEARSYGEVVCQQREGWIVAKVRKAPTTPVDNLSRKGR